MPPPVFEEMDVPQALPDQMDWLWARGWRHFGRSFFRYSLGLGPDGEVQYIQPLRLEVGAFRPSKSQRRVWRRNADVELRVAPAVVDAEREGMFLRHRERFICNVPESLRTFIPSKSPATEPCECRCVEARLDGKLVAVSYFDVGAEAISSVYAMFEPEAEGRSLGTLTMLREIEWAREQGKRWLYPGYATVQPSHYDYKKGFRPLSVWDWRGTWVGLEG